MIRNILFDFGGVLYDIDFNLTAQAFEKAGVPHFNQLYSQHSAAPFFVDYEKGLLTNEDFFNEIRNISGTALPDEAIKNAWNALLINYRWESIDYLKTLSQKYNLYLLSNTNALHYDYFSAQLKKASAYPSLESFFTKAWLSQQIHYRKPDLICYEFILKDGGLAASETLFIDDTSGNMPVAAKVGIQTHLLLPAERIENLGL